MHKFGTVLLKRLAKERGLAMRNRQEDARRARRLARISRPSDRLSINSEKLFLFMLICLRNLLHRGTPPQPGIIAPASGWSERCICNAACSSSLMTSTIQFVKTLVSRKIMCVLYAIGVSLSRGRRATRQSPPILTPHGLLHGQYRAILYTRSYTLGSDPTEPLLKDAENMV